MNHKIEAISTEPLTLIITEEPNITEEEIKEVFEEMYRDREEDES